MQITPIRKVISARRRPGWIITRITVLHDDRLTRPLKKQADGTFAAVSWDEALSGIAERLNQVRDTHGGDAFAFCGGGGQGNHLGALYAQQLLSAMGSQSSSEYNTSAQVSST